MLAPCPACGSFSLESTELASISGQALTGNRIHVECRRCHWLGTGDTVTEDDILTDLTNIGQNDRLWW